MAITRKILLGPPHTYVVHVESVQQNKLFDAFEANRILSLIEQLRPAFDLRVFAYRITPTSFHLVIRHIAQLHDPDHYIRNRWQAIGGSPLTPLNRIKQRFTSLGGFMQTALQRFSRDHNRRHNQRGHLWAGRFRACLLADDLALLAAIAWLEDNSTATESVVACSAQYRSYVDTPVMLTPVPIRIGPDGLWYTADESPPGLTPMRDAEVHAVFEDFVKEIPTEDLGRYGDALCHGWAFGRPDSLSQTLSRLTRTGGRGRYRKIHDLDDQLGLCGVWG